jgi:hypothetical protein
MKTISYQKGLVCVSDKQFRKIMEVLNASMKWKAQGSRSKWSTVPSLELFDAVEKLENEKD